MMIVGVSDKHLIMVPSLHIWIPIGSFLLLDLMLNKTFSLYEPQEGG